jgi:hypothetical protein
MKSIPELQEQIKHAEYKVSVAYHEWQNEPTIAGSTTKHSAYELVLEHLEDLQNQMHQAVLRADYLNQSV